jgi:hypothetical protein
MHSDEVLTANFQPSEAKLLASSSNSNLLVESPILASALSNLFPYLLLIDNVLEIVTWTNEEPFVNFLFLVGYASIVVYWNIATYLLLPMFFAIGFSCVVWTVSSIIRDSKFNERPTIDEVLNTLHNITVRFEMILRPVKHFRSKRRNFVRLFILAIILTPLQYGLSVSILPPRRFILIVGIFVLSYHSPWAFSIRRLIWRSFYVRLLAFYITGLDIKLTKAKVRPIRHNSSVSAINTPSTSDVEELNSMPILAGFKILKKVIVSPSQMKQVVVFEVLENQRRWLGLGWSNIMMPNERPNWCFEKSMEPAPSVITENTDEDFPFPVFVNDLYKYHWDWIEPIWVLDKKFGKGKAKEGQWQYYDGNWLNGRSKDGFSRYTRSRRWIRKAELIIDKQHETLDA